MKNISKIIVFSVVLLTLVSIVAISGVEMTAQAQISTPNYWKKIGSNVYPLTPGSTTIGTSTAIGQFKTLTDANGNKYVTSTGGVSATSSNNFTVPQSFNGISNSSNTTSTSFTDNTTSTPSWFANNNTEIDAPTPANMPAGFDLYSWINNVYNANFGVVSSTFFRLPSGFFNVSTTLSITNNQETVFIQCAPGGGTIINWTGNGTSTIWNYGSSASASGYTAHTYSAGFDGCTFLGPSAAGTSTMAVVGGTQGAEGWKASNNRFIGWGSQALSFGNNAWQVNVLYNLFIGNGKHITSITQSNGGERPNAIGNTFGDIAGTVTSSTLETCLDINGVVGMNFVANNFDDCGITFRSTARGVNMSGNYFENPGVSDPNFPAYRFMTLTANSFGSVVVNGMMVTQDASNATSTAASFFNNGASLVLNGFTCQANSSATTTAQIVNETASTASLSAVGVINTSSTCFTRIDQAAPTSTTVLNRPYQHTGSGTYAFSVATGTIVGFVDEFTNRQSGRVNWVASNTGGLTDIITFGKAWNNVPICTMTSASTTNASTIVRAQLITTTTLTFSDSTAFPTSSAWNFICVGNPD